MADNEHIAKLIETIKMMATGNYKQQMPLVGPNLASTYAAALRKGLPAWSGPPQERDVPTRLARELVVTYPNGTTPDRNRPISQIVEGINKMKDSSIAGKVIAARQLPSGDVLVTTDTAETKEGLERDPKWLPVINQAAKINRRKFTVIVHGMRVAALDCSKQEEAIRQLLGQNTHLKDSVEILGARWPKRALKKGKPNTHLIVDVASPAQANLLINEGLLFHSELKNCELFHGDCRVTQCFNCYEYGHIARVCRKGKKCGICASPGHDDQACRFRDVPTRHRCVNCSRNHPAWASGCDRRKEHVEKARLAYASRPRRYRVNDYGQCVSLGSQRRKEQPNQDNTSNQTESGAHAGETEGWQVVPFKGTYMEGIQSGRVRERSVVGNALGKRNRTDRSTTPRGRAGRPPSRPRAGLGDQNIAELLSQNESS